MRQRGPQTLIRVDRFSYKPQRSFQGLPGSPSKVDAADVWTVTVLRPLVAFFRTYVL